MGWGIQIRDIYNDGWPNNKNADSSKRTWRTDDIAPWFFAYERERRYFDAKLGGTQGRMTLNELNEMGERKGTNGRPCINFAHSLARGMDYGLYRSSLPFTW